MSSIAAPHRRRVLADALGRPATRSRAFAVDAALVLSGVALVDSVASGWSIAAPRR